MNTLITRVILATASVVLAALALASASHLPTTCADPCTIQASFGGYVAPVVVVDNGTNVTWVSIDSTHVQADRQLLPAFPECFAVSGGKGVFTPAVRFAINGSDLEASTAGAEPVKCPNANPLPDGSFELSYYCKLHPTMRGSIVVTP